MTRHALVCSLLLTATALAQDPPALPEKPADTPVEIPADAWKGVEKVATRLRLRLRVGSSSRYELRQHLTVETGGAGPGQTMDQTFGVKREIVEAPEGGTAKIRETYESIAYSIQVGEGKPIAVDTRDGTTSGNAVIDAMGAMVGAELVTKVGADGKVESVEGGAAMLERVVTAIPAGPQQDMMRTSLQQTLSDAALARKAQETFLLYPDRELASGDGWRRETTNELPNVGELPFTFDYVYLGTVDHPLGRCARLVVRLRSPGCEPRETVLQNSFPATVSVEPFETTSAILVRLEDGMPIESGPQTLRMTLHIDVAGQRVTAKNETVTRLETVAQGPDEPAEQEGR